jgi:hypothetical protein
VYIIPSKLFVLFFPYKEVNIMAYSAASGNPGRFFTGANVTTVSAVSGIFIPFSALESYSIATSGDIRELAYSFLDKFVTGLNALGNDGPTKVVATRATTITSDTTAQKVFNVTFDLNTSSTVYDVVDE